MSKQTQPTQAFIFDISKLPEDFAVARMQNLLVTFDNLNGNPSYQEQYRRTNFPVKCEPFFAITIKQGFIRLHINLHEVEVHQGQALVMTPGCIFETKEVSENCRFTGIAFAKDYMDGIRKSLGFHSNLTERYNYYAVQTLPANIIEHNQQMYKLLCQEMQNTNYVYMREIIQRYCEIWILKNLSMDNNLREKPEVNKQLNRKEQIFHDFLTLLEEHFTQERSISFYADRMCLTPKYLSTTIKEVSGKNGMLWIDEYVALEAQALLKSSKLSVKQISEQLNFPSQSMFGRFFKKMTGYSPKQYKFL